MITKERAEVKDTIESTFWFLAVFWFGAGVIVTSILIWIF